MFAANFAQYADQVPAAVRDAGPATDGRAPESGFGTGAG